MVWRPTALALALACGASGCSFFLGDNEGGDGDGDGDDPSLESLVVSRGNLQPEFDPDTTDYDLVLGLAARDLEIVPTAADAGAEIEVDSTAVGSGTATVLDLAFGATAIDIVVTAGTASRTYTINASRGTAVSDAGDAASPGPDLGNRFGESVAVGDDLLVVGEPVGDDPSAGVDDTGVVYIFERVFGEWVERQTLVPSNPEANARFGAAVAISGTDIVVGAPNEASGQGAAYVFTLGDPDWVEDERLESVSEVPGTNDHFGSSVDIDGAVVIVGAPDADGPGNMVLGSGSAFVFEKVGVAWNEVGHLRAETPGPDDGFGSAVALAGNRAVVGAPGEDGGNGGIDPAVDNSAADAGAAYSFFDDGGWIPERYVKPQNPVSGASFGASVDFDGQTAVIGAPFENGSGAVYVFAGQSGALAEQARLEPENPAAVKQLGHAVAVEDDVVVATSRTETADVSGALYVFGRNGADWIPLLRSLSMTGEVDDELGASVALFRDVIAIGAPVEDVDSNTDVGAVHTFH